MIHNDLVDADVFQPEPSNQESDVEERELTCV